MNKFLKTSLIVVLCLSVFVACSGCVTNITLDQNSNVTDGKWIISDYIYAITEDTDVSYKDDFHAAVNKQWLLSTDIYDKDPVFINDPLTDINREKEIAALTDNVYVGSEDEKMSTLMSQLLDRDERNRVGLTPIIEGAKEILALKTTDDIRKYLTTHDDTALMIVSVESDPLEEGYCVILTYPLFSMPTVEKYDEIQLTGNISIPYEAELAYQFYQTMGQGIGLPHDTITKLYVAQLALEKELAAAKLADDARLPDSATVLEKLHTIYLPVTIDKLKKNNFPVDLLTRDFTSKGITDFVECNPNVLETYNKLFTDANIDGLKSMLLYGYFYKYAPFLDDNAYTAYSKLTGIGSETMDPNTALTFIESISPVSLSKVYADNYVSSEAKSKAEWIVKMYIKAYRELINETSWASDSLKEKAIEKIENTRMSVAYPKWDIYGLDNLKISKTSLIDNVDACNNAWKNYLVNKSLLTSDCPDAWISQATLVYTVNASNNPLGNTIIIPAGIFGGTYFNIDADIEENIAGLGFVIGHELSHSLDKNGAYYDKDGNISFWWTEDDVNEYSKRLERLENYLSQPVIFGNQLDGGKILAEATADITGIGVSMIVASYLPDFDYQKFFKAYARGWATAGSYQAVLNIIQNDEHPLNYLRTNIPVQQFEEFYSAFDVRKGDKMYLSPEERMIIWGL